MASETTLARVQVARDNESYVLAEGALEGERAIASVRLVLMLARGVSMSLVARDPTMGFDPATFSVIVAYVVFSVGVWWVLRKQKTNVRQAQYVPLFLTVVDVGFVTAIGLRVIANGQENRPEMTVGALSVVIAFSVLRLGVWQIVFATVLSAGSYVGLCLYQGTLGSSLRSLTFVLVGFGVLAFLLERTNTFRRKSFLKLRRADNLSRFLPRPVVDRLLNQGEDALLPVQRVVTVMFLDIRGFTALSEKLAPREVLAFLDEFLGHMSQIVKGRDGLVNKFLGDGMLAFWGVPDEHPDHALLAVRAALDMRVKLAELNSYRRGLAQDEVRIGIGLHTGVVAAGMLGGADQHEYTIIGDAVNVASRIEGLTKQFDADLLVSDATYRELKGKILMRAVGEHKVKGREVGVTVWSPDADPADPDDAAASSGQA